MERKRIALSALGALSEADRLTKLAEIVEAAGAPLNGEVKEIDRRISDLEDRFGMTSDEMVKRAREHTIGENGDTWLWMSLLERRKRLVHSEATSPSSIR